MYSFNNKCPVKSCYSLPFLGLQGLYSVTNKSDCEGAYSPGESMDICALLRKIKPFLIEKRGFLNEPWFEDIYDVFEESWTTQKNVFIR